MISSSQQVILCWLTFTCHCNLLCQTYQLFLPHQVAVTGNITRSVPKSPNNMPVLCAASNLFCFLRVKIFFFIFSSGGQTEAVDKRIIEKVEELSNEEVQKVSEMQRHITNFVSQELFRREKLHPKTRRRY